MFRSNDELRKRPGRAGAGGGSRYIEVGGGGGGVRRGGPTAFAKITGRAGTAAPWQYTGVEMERVGTAWVEVDEGADLGWKLYNLYEVGPDGAGGNPVEDDAIVAYWAEGGKFWFERSPYKGTY